MSGHEAGHEKGLDAACHRGLRLLTPFGGDARSSAYNLEQLQVQGPSAGAPGRQSGKTLKRELGRNPAAAMRAAQSVRKRTETIVVSEHAFH